MHSHSPLIRSRRPSMAAVVLRLAVALLVLLAPIALPTANAAVPLADPCAGMVGMADMTASQQGADEHQKPAKSVCSDACVIGCGLVAPAVSSASAPVGWRRQAPVSIAGLHPPGRTLAPEDPPPR